MSASLAELERRIVACERCPELRAYCAEVARTKKREYREQSYWGRPVPAFGDPQARVVLVGLAPGAHGSNRTGRMFTGDASGVWLYRALHRAGFANVPTQVDRDDGMVLRDVLITAALRCAPPGNKPAPAQLRNCFPYLKAELAALGGLRVVVGLGAIGGRAAAQALREAGYRFERRPLFAHGAEAAATRDAAPRRIVLLHSYHPSRQNTNTGVLTEPMFDAIFERAKGLLEEGESPD
ncbi:MAG: uracil-DNA glycosylase [Candidatus Baltobacteraceae bacterium]